MCKLNPITENDIYNKLRFSNACNKLELSIYYYLSYGEENFNLEQMRNDYDIAFNMHVFDFESKLYYFAKYNPEIFYCLLIESIEGFYDCYCYKHNIEPKTTHNIQEYIKHTKIKFNKIIVNPSISNAKFKSLLPTSKEYYDYRFISQGEKGIFLYLIKICILLKSFCEKNNKTDVIKLANFYYKNKLEDLDIYSNDY